MAKEQKTIGLFPELIIHPGETLAEILEDREMSQKELAVRTGMTEKHVSTVVKGQKSISVAFAKKLEYALGVDAGFWINLQAIYDRELLEFVYVLYAWQRICELVTRDIEVSDELDISLLKKYIPQIKNLMFEEINIVQGKLESIFAECGIAFKIVRHFQGAPVQGFIKKTDNEKLILCMTIRKGRADIFWFTLFHEIGHIINGDVKQRFIDFDSTQSDMEAKADVFSRDILMNALEYKEFVLEKDYSLSAIDTFAKKQGVKSYIVIGRLQLDSILGWNQYNSRIEYYKWAE